MSGSGRFLQILTLRCEGASELSSRELDEPLRTLERVALWGHLLACASCRRFHRQIRLIRRAARLRDRMPAARDREDDVLSSEARDRIARAIRKAAADGPDGESGER
jgi:hypothetical protein